MEDLRKEIKRKFDLLNPIQLGLIGYWFKLSKDINFNDPKVKDLPQKILIKLKYSRNEYLKRIKEILKEVQ